MQSSRGRKQQRQNKTASALAMAMFRTHYPKGSFQTPLMVSFQKLKLNARQFAKTVNDFLPVDELFDNSLVFFTSHHHSTSKNRSRKILALKTRLKSLDLFKRIY
jgi:patatin-like phospholipase/acyl hydrolase